MKNFDYSQFDNVEDFLEEHPEMVRIEKACKNKVGMYKKQVFNLESKIKEIEYDIQLLLTWINLEHDEVNFWRSEFAKSYELYRREMREKEDKEDRERKRKEREEYL